jgi:DNA polymerase-3 subunit epsilon
MADFATLDFETTGLTPNSNRVIEVGVVRTSRSGRVVDEFTTLVNPQRDVGRTDIHGISAGMLTSAPAFSEISGHLAEILNGAIVVAHNASFDSRFLAAEFHREGREHASFDLLCTLELMYQGFPRGPRKLVECCRFLEISIRDAHCALDDAQMASELLHELLKRVRPAFLPEPSRISVVPEARGLPMARNKVLHPRDVEATFLSELISSLPDEGPLGVTSAVAAAQYLNLLDKILEDRRIDEEEAFELVDVAREIGLSPERIVGLNSAYMANLCAAAVADGEVSDAERLDLSTVARLLKIEEWEPLLVGEKAASSSNSEGGLTPGLTVCFTGEMSAPRSEFESRSTHAGLEVKSSVTKKLDLLIVADSDTESTKARRARELGVRILHEHVFLRMLDEVGV